MQTRKFNPGKGKAPFIDSMITAPLVAASKANSMMLKEQTQFIMDYCFQKMKNGSYSPIMIEMSMINSVTEPTNDDKQPVKIETIETRFHLPLLTILPLNSLAVDEVKLNFSMEIISQTIQDPDEEGSDDDTGTDPPKVQLKGKICSDSTTSTTKEQPDHEAENKNSTTSKLEVNINVSPLPLPVGLKSIIDLYVKSIRPIPAPEEKKKKKKKKKKRNA